MQGRVTLYIAEAKVPLQLLFGRQEQAHSVAVPVFTATDSDLRQDAQHTPSCMASAGSSAQIGKCGEVGMQPGIARGMIITHHNRGESDMCRKKLSLFRREWDKSHVAVPHLRLLHRQCAFLQLSCMPVSS